MSNTNRPTINSANPYFMLGACNALRNFFGIKYGCRETEWTAVYADTTCASIKDEFGGSWDIDLINKSIIPAM